MPENARRNAASLTPAFSAVVRKPDIQFWNCGSARATPAPSEASNAIASNIVVALAAKAMVLLHPQIGFGPDYGKILRKHLPWRLWQDFDR
jgi:hypothetical protein